MALISRFQSSLRRDHNLECVGIWHQQRKNSINFESTLKPRTQLLIVFTLSRQQSDTVSVLEEFLHCGTVFTVIE